MIDKYINEIIAKYKKLGHNKFCDHLVSYSFIYKEERIRSPELILMDIHDLFLKLHRTNHEKLYLDISSAARKAAHLVYFKLLKDNKTKKSNRFLNIVV